MKVRIEIAEDQPEEVVIRCRELSEETERIRNALEDVLRGTELCLSSGDTVYFVPISSILFFETDGDCVLAHTADKVYSSGEKLYHLEQILPRTFVRVSKSCIVNSARVSFLRRGVTGTGEAGFSGSEKIAYVSRMYFGSLKEFIYETRITK